MLFALKCFLEDQFLNEEMKAIQHTFQIYV